MGFVMITRNTLVLLCAALGFLFSTTAANAATEIGNVIAVVGSPSASGPGGNRTLKAGTVVFEDDKITVSTGNAQIRLRDNTRLVVGPGSSLLLDRFLMKGNSRAQKISIKALRGTFRFITGRSAKSAYDIRTSNATIGIRGTGFDFWVKGQTGVAVLQGQVALCRGRNCVNLGSNCDVGVTGGGKTSLLAGRTASQAIANNLPFIRNQSSLRSAFRLSTNKCYIKNSPPSDRSTETKTDTPRPRPDPSPQPTPDPDPQPQPDPDPQTGGNGNGNGDPVSPNDPTRGP
jgi:FecR protein